MDTIVKVGVGETGKVRDAKTATDGVEDDADCSPITAIDKNKSLPSHLLAGAFDWAKSITVNAHALAHAASGSNCASDF